MIRSRVRGVVVVVLTIGGCGGGAGGGGHSGSSLAVLHATAESGGFLPQEDLFLNQRIVLRMTEPVDPASVSPDTVQVRDVSEGLAVAAAGDLVVEGDAIVFAPRLPVLPSYEDSGLRPGRTYRIHCPGVPDGITLRSRGGRRLALAFETTFSTRTEAPLFGDFSTGAPRAEALLVDLDGDGSFAADGRPETAEEEEHFLGSGAAPPLLPVGAARAPTLIGLLFSEPIDPSSLAADRPSIETTAAPLLAYSPDASPVRVSVSLRQAYDAGSGRYRPVLVLRPRTTLRGESSLDLVVDSIFGGFGSPPEAVEPFSIRLRTRATVPTDDWLEEEFTTLDFLDRSSTAPWNAADSGRLVAGWEVGGNGSDGAFEPSARSVTLSTDGPRAGLFDFTSFVVPLGTTVTIVGAHPARIRSLGDIDIRGRVASRGGDGAVAIAPGQAVAGGDGGAGAGRGGSANPGGTRTVTLVAEMGQSAPGVPVSGVCATSGDGRAGGGCPGRRAASAAGGGGGGGHRTSGNSDAQAPATSGQGGVAYSDAAVSVLLAGSGGGGGGNDEDGRPFDQDDPGGAGGGGGGAIAFETAGTFRLSGSIDCDGGRGGGGFRNSGGGGGGSGGAVRVRAVKIDPLAALSGALTCRGGTGGSLSAPGRPGGSGSPGFVRLETTDGSVVVDRSRFVIDPVESVGGLDAGAVTTGRSSYYATGAASPAFAFDGCDPSTGDLRPGAGATDLVMPFGVPEGTSARIAFFGARPSVAFPSEPDIATEFGPVADVAGLDGFSFIRFEVRFDLGTSPLSVTRPAIESIRIRFRFD